VFVRNNKRLASLRHFEYVDFDHNNQTLDRGYGSATRFGNARFKCTNTERYTNKTIENPFRRCLGFLYCSTFSLFIPAVSALLEKSEGNPVTGVLVVTSGNDRGDFEETDLCVLWDNTTMGGPGVYTVGVFVMRLLYYSKTTIIDQNRRRRRLAQATRAPPQQSLYTR